MHRQREVQLVLIGRGVERWEVELLLRLCLIHGHAEVHITTDYIRSSLLRITPEVVPRGSPLLSRLLANLLYPTADQALASLMPGYRSLS